MKAPAHLRGVVILTAYAFLASPPVRAGLESGMVGHMLVQIPLLAIIGALWAPLIPARLCAQLSACNARGIPLTLLALFAATYWMLPRALDAALDSAVAELAKFITLPLLVGLPLALSWRRLALIGQGFVWSNFISMLGVLGWLYIVSPVRVCNNYLVNQQVVLGQGMLAVTLALFVVGAARVFVGGPPRDARQPSSSFVQMNS